MSDFIINECKRFALIIQADAGKFENLSVLKERFQKEITPYSSYESKDLYLTNLALELDKLLQPHLSRCKKSDCPQRKAYQNIMFLLSENSNEKMLSSYLINNEEYTRILEGYNKKLLTTSSFLDKEQFITQELSRIKTLFIHPKIDLKVLSPGKLISSFDFSEYSKFAYEWLMRGHDFTIAQIVKNAKNQYDSLMPSGFSNDKQFEEAIHSNLQRGVAYVLYEKHLNDELKSISESKNKTPLKYSNSKKRTTIPFKIKARLLKEINSVCPFCPSDEVGHFEVHHIDENCENNDYQNLLMVCPTCHSKITKGDISKIVVNAAKKQVIK